jgi:hypothetical protein
MIAHIPSVAGVLVGLTLLTGASRGDEPVANAKARLEAARKVYEGMIERRRIDISAALDPDRFYQWSRRWFEADRDLGANKQASIAAAERHLERMKKMESLFRSWFEQGMASLTEVPAATFFRLEAERTLMELEAK